MPQYCAYLGKRFMLVLYSSLKPYVWDDKTLKNVAQAYNLGTVLIYTFSEILPNHCSCLGETRAVNAIIL